MATDKKRTIDEYRQTKEYYTAPVSHYKLKRLKKQEIDLQLFDALSIFMLTATNDDDIYKMRKKLKKILK